MLLISLQVKLETEKKKNIDILIIIIEPYIKSPINNNKETKEKKSRNIQISTRN